MEDGQVQWRWRLCSAGRVLCMVCLWTYSRLAIPKSGRLELTFSA